MENNRLIDSYGRSLDYLRISLTDHCNYRCVYCLPPEGITSCSRKEILDHDEIIDLATLFAALGVRRLRLTGGEPLMRSNIVSLIDELSTLEGIDSIALTTNGSRLVQTVESLRMAGLKGINLSLDSLQRKRFASITGRDHLPLVMKGLEKAIDLGFVVKINVVALADLSREEVHSFCSLANRLSLDVRFLEVMPLNGKAWHENKSLSIATVKNWVEERYSLNPLPRHNQPAESYELGDGHGRVGFISPISKPFCHECNRLRLTSNGQLRLCLYSHQELDLRGMLRKGATRREIKQAIVKAVQYKPIGYEILQKTQDASELPKIRILGG